MTTNIENMQNTLYTTPKGDDVVLCEDCHDPAFVAVRVKASICGLSGWESKPTYKPCDMCKKEGDE